MKSRPPVSGSANSKSIQNKERHNNARRRLLKSVAASGAAVTVKALPDKWAKPMLETTMLPAHAQATTCALECRVVEIDTSPGTLLSPVTPALPIPGGGTVNLHGFGAQDIGACGNAVDFGASVQSVFVEVVATVDPGCSAADLTAGLSGGQGVFALTGGGDQTGVINPVTGAVSFNAVTVEFDATGFTVNASPTTVSAELDLSVQAGTSNCVINVIFTEHFYCDTP